MKLLIIFSAIALFQFAFVREDANIMNVVATRDGGLVAGTKPLNALRVERESTKDYADNLLRNSNKILDTNMFSQILANAAKLDTSVWQDHELKNLLVVKSNDENISEEYLFKKMNLTGKKRIKFYKRKINRYNSTNPSDRKICYFSRPVYNNTREYAIIQWSNLTDNATGAGGITLYHLQNEVWVKEGELVHWSN